MTLWDMPASTRAMQSTSLEAHRSLANVSAVQGMIVGILREHGPMTDEQIAACKTMSVSPSGLRTRRKELVEIGVVVDSGARGETASGRASILWRLSE